MEESPSDSVCPLRKRSDLSVLQGTTSETRPGGQTGENRLANLPLNKEQGISLRKKFSIMPGQHMVILIGKDGELKLRKQLPVELSEIFSVIDAMPMRQREMRERPK